MDLMKVFNDVYKKAEKPLNEHDETTIYFLKQILDQLNEAPGFKVEAAGMGDGFLTFSVSMNNGFKDTVMLRYAEEQRGGRGVLVAWVGGGGWMEEPGKQDLESRYARQFLVEEIVRSLAQKKAESDRDKAIGKKFKSVMQGPA